MAATPPVVTPVPSRPQLCSLAVTSLILGIVGLCLCFLGPLFGIPAVICGHLGLSRINAAGGALSGRGAAIGGLVTGYLAIASVVVSAAVLLPALTSAREKARSISCMNNMKQVGTGVLMFANDNGMVLPPNLESLKPYLGPSGDAALACPSAPSPTGDGPRQDYEYLGAGLKLSEIKQPTQTVILVETAARHNRGMNVVFADGHAEYVAATGGQDWRSVAATKGWVVPRPAQP